MKGDADPSKDRLARGLRRVKDDSPNIFDECDERLELVLLVRRSEPSDLEQREH